MDVKQDEKAQRRCAMYGHATTFVWCQDHDRWRQANISDITSKAIPLQ